MINPKPYQTNTGRHLLALQRAARKQTDPVKRGRIVEKINEIKQKKVTSNWLSR